MSFAIRNLSVIGYCNGFTLWHYRSPDSLIDIAAPGYFRAATDMMAMGDHIHVDATGGGGLLEFDGGERVAVLAGMQPWRAVP